MSGPAHDVAPPTGPRDDPFREGPVAARARRTRSLGIALALVAFVVVVFIVSMIKIAAASHVASGAQPGAASSRVPSHAPNPAS